MLRKLRIFIINQIGFSRKEANGTIVLVLIISLILFLPLAVKPFLPINKTETNSDSFEAWYDEVNKSIKSKPVVEKPFKLKIPSTFDPNTLPKNEWENMGIATTIAERIHKYIQAGGHFYEPNDLYKIYGIDSSIVSQLLPHIAIASSKKDFKKEFKKEKKQLTEKRNETTPVRKHINLTSQEDLKSIRGIGEKLSLRIKRYGDSLGGYYYPSQLTEVYYLHDSIIPFISTRFLFDTAHLQQIQLNSDSLSKLRRHPYISYNQARAIINYRHVHGGFDSIPELKAVKIISDSIYIKLIPYLSIKD